MKVMNDYWWSRRRRLLRMPGSCGAWTRTPRSSWSSAGPMFPMRTAVCLITSAASSPKSRHCWWRRPRCSKPISRSMPGRCARRSPSTRKRKRWTSRTTRPARSPPNPTTSWSCRRAHRRSGRRCPESTCRASSRSERCRTPGNIRQWLDQGTPFLAGMSHYSGIQAVRPKTRAVVVGGGFIGLEMTENLVHRGLDVTLVGDG